ncbi:MAG: S1C family serine protease [Bacillus sp. (in: firmicutes)]
MNNHQDPKEENVNDYKETEVENNNHQDPEEENVSDYKEAEVENIASDETIKQEQKEEKTVIAAKQRKPKEKKSTGWLKTISAGVVGSVLTLSILPFTDYSEWVDRSEQSATVQQENSSSESSNSGAVKIQQTTTAASSIADMVEKAVPAIVGVVNIQQSQNNYFYPQQGQRGQSSEGVETGSGSGVIFKKDSKYAYIVTNNHVIENAQTIEISLESGEKTTAQLIGTDALSDLAVLTIDAKYAESVLEFGDSDQLRTGEQVVAIGNPLGLDFSRSVTQGIVSALNRSVTVSTSAGDWEMNVLQTDAAINAGNSGGALINTAGQVIGINSLKISENGVEGLGFAIPSNEAVPIINEIIEKGKVERVYLGVGLAGLDEIPGYYLQNLPQNVEEGVMITSVNQNSAAGKAGLQVQDVIVSINGHKVSNSVEFRKYLYTNLKVGDKATLKLYRQGEMKTVEVTLASNNGIQS